MKTTELIGPALDWAVAKATGRMGQWTRDEARPLTGIVDIDFDESGRLAVYVPGRQRVPYAPWSPSTDWAQGGPIIERELCELVKGQSGSTGPVYWEARAGFEDEPGHAIQYGPTPLIAAMRCYVASKLGDEVEIPEELLPTQLDADKARLAQARRAFDQNPTPPLSTIIRRLAASVARQEKAK